MARKAPKSNASTCHVSRSAFNELKAQMEASRSNFDKCNRPAAEKALNAIYDNMGFSRPSVVWVDGFKELHTLCRDGKLSCGERMNSPLLRDLANCHVFNNKHAFSKFPGFDEILVEFLQNPTEVRVIQEAIRRANREVRATLDVKEPLTKALFCDFYHGFSPLDSDIQSSQGLIDAMVLDKEIQLERAVQFTTHTLGTTKMLFFTALMARSDFGIFPFQETWQTHWPELASNCGFMSALGDTIVLGERPVRVSHDDRLRLHNDKEAAFEGRDGLKLYYIDGVRLPDPNIVMAPTKQSIEEITGENNAEVRAIRMRQFGMMNFIQKTDPKVIDKRSPATANRKTIEMLCSTSHLQGLHIFVCQCISTGRIFTLFVPNNIVTCQAAQEWVLGQNWAKETDCLLTT